MVIKTCSKFDTKFDTKLDTKLDQNFLHQHGHHSNIKMTQTPDSITNKHLESKVIEILNSIVDDKVIEKNIKDCHVLIK